jgi:hypothetical protein
LLNAFVFAMYLSYSKICCENPLRPFKVSVLFN